MTERWRKKLQGLDGVGPDDEVFARAKAGPQLPDEAIPGPKTSTRIVTVIAAFLVFALAISVFAIPALRLKDDGAAPIQGAGAGIQPLWPWRTLDDVKAFAADPQPVNGLDPSAAFAPDQLASAFGTQVLGWGYKVWAVEEGAFSGTEGGAFLPSGSIGNPYTLAPSTASDSAFRTYSLSTCPQLAVCDYVYPGPGDASVVVYQPLGADGPWAVIEAKSQYLDLSAGPGDVVHDGSQLAVQATVPNKYDAELAVHVGTGINPCDSMQASAVFDPAGDPGGGISLFHPMTAAMSVDYSSMTPGETCPPADAAYVFAAIAEEPLVGDALAADPLAHGGPRLFAFAAVPIVALSDDTGATEAPPPSEVTVTSTASAIPPVGWTTYTDPLGWTIDVPDTWVSDSFDAFGGRVTTIGAWFSSAQPQVVPGDAQEPVSTVAAPGAVMLKIWHNDGGVVVLPTNDSAFPLSYDNVRPAEMGNELFFEGDGLSFVLAITSSDGTITAPQEDILRRMVGSIHFAPWTKGETRNGLTSLGAAGGYPVGSETVDAAQAQVLVHAPGGFYLLEAGACPSGPDVTAGDGGQIGVTCGGATGMYSKTGMPDGQNPVGFDQPLSAHPAYVASDGSVLLAFGITLASDGSWATDYWPA